MELETISITRGCTNELIRMNLNLVKTSRSLQQQLRNACQVIGRALDLAEPIYQAHEEDPQEYVLPAEEIEALRCVILVAKVWGGVDES